MLAIANELQTVISKHVPLLEKVPENEQLYKSSPDKWSKKEILGHLVDSAQTNIRRFVVAQYEDCPSIGYKQDNWVKINDYQNWNWQDLVQLWKLQNSQVVHILKNSADAGSRQCMTQEIYTIEWLAQDYVKHLLHHLHQVLGFDPIAYP
jgi:hypothetical protein